MKIDGLPIIRHVTAACSDFHTVAVIPEGDKELEEAIPGWVDIYEGPEENVAGRFAIALRHLMPEYFIRVCADSPMLTPEILGKVAIWPGYDVVRTVGVAGLNVEMVNTNVFLHNLPKFSAEDREHVTSYFYRLNGFKILNYQLHGEPCVVDTMEDYLRVKEMMECGHS